MVRQLGLVLLSACALAGCATTQYVEEPIDFSRRARLVDGPEGARLIFPDGLLFDFNSANLRTEAVKSMDDCGFILDRVKGDLIVEGHTDSRGSTVSNQRLSKVRAEAVRKELLNRKIAPSRIEVRALGSAKPEVQSASTEEQHALNRRAEIIFKGETVSSLGAPYGCGGPPERRRVDSPGVAGKFVQAVEQAGGGAEKSPQK